MGTRASDARPRRLRAAVLLGIAIAAGTVVPARVASSLAINARDRQQDFGIFYGTARCLIVETCAPYALQPRSAPNLAPPHAHLILGPVLWLSRPAAYWAWLVVSAVVLIGTAIWVAGVLALPRSWAGWILAATLVAGSSLTTSLVESGQIYAVLTAPVVASWIAWRRGDPRRAAFWMALPASVKVLLVLPLAWFGVAARPRATLVGLATLAVVAATGLVWFGTDAYAAWLTMLSGAPMAGHYRDASIMQTLVRTLSATSSFAPVVDAPGLIRPVWAVLSGLLVAVVAVRRLDPDRAFLAVLVTSLLVTPIGWIYAGWWVVPPAIAVWRSASFVSRAALASIGVGMWLPDMAPLWGQPSPLLTPLWGSLYFWLLVGVYIVAVSSRPHPTRGVVTLGSSGLPTSDATA